MVFRNNFHNLWTYVDFSSYIVILLYWYLAYLNFFKIFFSSTFFIYFWDRERQSMHGGGAETEGDTKSEAGSMIWAISTEPDAGLELMDHEIVTWAKVGRLTDWATQAPLFYFIFWEKERERERETEHEWGRAEREGDTESEVGYRLWADSRASRGARTHGPLHHDLSWSQTLNQLSHPGAPHPHLKKIFFNVYHFSR